MPITEIRKPCVVNPNWADWEFPIILRISSRRAEVLANPAEALSFLVNGWNGDRDETFEAARKACSGVLRRRVSPDEARAAVARFANDAHLTR